MKKALKTIERGTPFTFAGQRWIALEHDPAGRTLCLTEDITEERAFDDGNRNDWGKSSSCNYLNGPFLDNLIDRTASGGPLCGEALRSFGQLLSRDLSVDRDQKLKV